MNIINFLLILFSVFLVFLAGLIFFDKNGKISAKKRFRALSSKLIDRSSDMRSVPRIAVPEQLEIFLRFSEESYKRMKIKVVDLSLAGLRANFNYRVRRFPDSMSFKDAAIVTPSAKIKINSINVTRIESQVKKGIIAFRFKDMDENQFELLKKTISDIREFSNNGR